MHKSIVCVLLLAVAATAAAAPAPLPRRERELTHPEWLVGEWYVSVDATRTEGPLRGMSTSAVSQRIVLLAGGKNADGTKWSVVRGVLRLEVKSKRDGTVGCFAVRLSEGSFDVDGPLLNHEEAGMKPGSDWRWTVRLIPKEG